TRPSTHSRAPTQRPRSCTWRSSERRLDGAHQRAETPASPAAGAGMSDPRVQIVASGDDRMADTFAAWRDRIDGDPRAGRFEELASRIPDGARVLELGCGAGSSAETQELARRFRLTGVDVSGEQIRRARAKVPGAELVQADFLEIDLPTESFEAECSFYVFN